MIYKRDILSSIKQCADEYGATLLTGARQVGKTTLLSYFEKELGYEYVTFDDTDSLVKAKENTKDFIKEHPDHVIFDEVQRIPEIFVEIEAKINERKKERGSESANGMFILSGSQKFNLMKGVSESMSGRVGIIEMPTLSQSEIRGWNSEPFVVNNDFLFDRCNNRKLLDDELYESIVRGFYPARWEIPGKPIKNYYSNYFKTYIEKDVLQLINIRNKQKFENFIRVLASLTGKEYIPDNIAKIVGIDKNTVVAWFNIALTCDIISLLPPYYEDSISKRIVKRSKLYFNDTGLCSYLLGIDTPKTLMRSSFKGSMVETYIHNEIIKSYKNAGTDINAFYYRDSNKNEIDLIIQYDGKLDLIECKAGKNFSSSDIKGFKQLDNTKYELSGRCVICTCDEPYRISSGTYAFPIRCL